MLHNAFVVILRSQDCSINLSVVALDGNMHGYSQEWVLWMVPLCVSYKLFYLEAGGGEGASVHSFPQQSLLQLPCRKIVEEGCRHVCNQFYVCSVFFLIPG